MPSTHCIAHDKCRLLDFSCTPYQFTVLFVFRLEDCTDLVTLHNVVWGKKSTTPELATVNDSINYISVSFILQTTKSAKTSL